MKNIVVVISMLIFSCISNYAYAQGETITLSTYYPAPYGEYKKLSVGDGYTAPADPIDLIVEGDVGIGTPTPAYKLDVAPDSDTSVRFGRTVVGYGAYSDYAWFSHTDRVSAGNYALLQSNNGTTFLNSSTGTPICFRENNADRMRLTGGNLGIGTGTATPGARLVVDAGNNLPTDGNGAIFQGLDTFSNFGISIFNPSTTGLRSNIIRFAYNNGIGNPVNVAYIRSQNVSTNAANGGRLIFETYQNNTGTLNSFLVLIDRDGTIDIGNPSSLPTNSINAARLRIAHNGVPLQFYETGSNRPNIDEGGLWRMPLDIGALRFDVNTASTGDFASYVSPLIMNHHGNVGIGAWPAGAGGYRLYVNGSAYASGGWSSPPSDLRLKKNVEKLPNVLKKLWNINGVRFDWRTDEFSDRGFTDEKQIGIIAQEIEKEFPELVSTDNEGYKAFAYDRFTAVLLEAIKEQQAQIDNLKLEIAELKK